MQEKERQAGVTETPLRRISHVSTQRGSNARQGRAVPWVEVADFSQAGTQDSSAKQMTPWLKHGKFARSQCIFQTALNDSTAAASVHLSPEILVLMFPAKRHSKHIGRYKIPLSSS